MPWDPAFQNQTLKATLSEIIEEMVRLAKTELFRYVRQQEAYCDTSCFFLIKLTMSGLVGITLTLRLFDDGKHFFDEFLFKSSVIYIFR